MKSAGRHKIDHWRFASLLAVVFIVGFPAIGSATVTPINLNDFFFFPGDPVSIAVDGSSATIGENDSSTVFPLINDPSAGDANVIVPGENTFLVFDFLFEEGAPLDDDRFSVFLLNADLLFSPPFLDPDFRFVTPDASTGSVEFALESLVGTTLGLQFQLANNQGDQGDGSLVTISHLRLETRDSQAVPEPTTLLLLGICLAGLAFARRPLH